MLKFPTIYRSPEGPGGSPTEAPKVVEATPPAVTPPPTETTLKTLVSGGASEPPAATAPVTPAWRDDWREALAGEDKAFLNDLKKYGTISDYAKATQSLRQKLSAGEIKPALPKDATPEQIKEYRNLHGIPETPNDYLTNLPNGVVVGEDDRALAAKFAEKMHGTNATKEQVAAGLQFYYEFAEEQAREDAKRASDFRRGAEDTLRTDWGKDFHENLERAGEVISMAPESVRSVLENARLPDGSTFGDHPDVAKWLVAISRDLNPVRTLLPVGGTGAIGSIQSEIDTIEKAMATPGSGYFRDDKMQARYRDLVEARERQKARAA